MAAPRRRRASTPALPDELIEEILLRLPPDDPACILRASVVCKAWSSAISHPSFRRRLHELHRAPPVLGFLHNWPNEQIPRFIPTTATSFEFSLAAPDCHSWRALDCRHGRALFLSEGRGTSRELLVWEPMRGAQQRVPVPAAFKSDLPTGAVCCAADGCDHSDCLGGPFRVVFVFAVELYAGAGEAYVTSACVYSSQTGTWGELTSINGVLANFEDISSVLVGRSLLYFMSNIAMILEYDLVRHSLTVLDTPDSLLDEGYNLILFQGGGLGVSQAMDTHLKLWSWEVNDGRWVLSRVIHLEKLLPNGALLLDEPSSVHVLGFAEGPNVIFILTLAGFFAIELESDRVRKVCDDYGFCNSIPVVGFYTPHSRLRALGVEQHKEMLKFAHELFDKGCKAMRERNFADASDCFRRALEIRVVHYGKLAPQCASTFFKYGRALLSKALAATNPSGSVSKSAPNEESVKITATASKDYSDEGENLNNKDQEDVNMTCNEANSDLDLAWKILDIARVIVMTKPEKTIDKVNIFCALAEIYMKREDRDTAIGYYLEALGILEHLVIHDHIGVVQLNFRLCLVFELASKAEDAIPYCAKAISVCQSLIHNLKNGKEALLADKDVSASAAKGHSGKITLEDKISFLTRILARFQKKLEELEQAMSTPTSGMDKIMKRAVSQTKS